MCQNSVAVPPASVLRETEIDNKQNFFINHLQHAIAPRTKICHPWSFPLGSNLFPMTATSRVETKESCKCKQEKRNVSYEPYPRLYFLPCFCLETSVKIGRRNIKGTNAI